MKQIISMFLAFLTLTAPIYANNVIADRCAQDQIAWDAKSHIIGRWKWTIKCFGTKPQAAIIKSIWQNGGYISVIQGTTGAEQALHPVFMKTDMSATWVAPQDAAAPCASPPWAYQINACANGCFDGDQLVLYKDGYRKIDTAVEEEKLDLVTLAPDSTFDAFDFQVNTVKSYVRDPVATLQTILEITTADGGTLKVTPTHPLVNGEGVMVRASTLKQGDSLVRLNGEKAVISRVTEADSETKVMNVTPVTEDMTSNVIVAQGFLSGSHMQQEMSLETVNRLIFRTSALKTDLN